MEHRAPILLPRSRFKHGSVVPEEPKKMPLHRLDLARADAARLALQRIAESWHPECQDCYGILTAPWEIRPQILAPTPLPSCLRPGAGHSRELTRCRLVSCDGSIPRRSLVFSLSMTRGRRRLIVLFVNMGTQFDQPGPYHGEWRHLCPASCPGPGSKHRYFPAKTCFVIDFSTRVNETPGYSAVTAHKSGHALGIKAPNTEGGYERK